MVRMGVWQKSTAQYGAAKTLTWLWNVCWPADSEHRQLKATGVQRLYPKALMMINTSKGWHRYDRQNQCGWKMFGAVWLWQVRQEEKRKRGLTETGVKIMSFLYKALLKNRAEIAKQRQEKEEEEEEQHIKSGQPITIACEAVQCVRLKLSCSLCAINLRWNLRCVVLLRSTSGGVGGSLIIVTLQNLFHTVSSLHSCISLFIYLLLWPQIFCFQFRQNGKSIDEHWHYSKENDTARSNSSACFPFALLGHPHLSYHMHPVNEVIHRGIGINTLDESTCAVISNPKNDIFSLTVHIPKLTVKSENFQNDNIHKVYPGPKSTDVCSCAAASHVSRWISSMNETLQFVYNQSTH